MRVKVINVTEAGVLFELKDKRYRVPLKKIKTHNCHFKHFPCEAIVRYSKSFDFRPYEVPQPINKEPDDYTQLTGEIIVDTDIVILFKQSKDGKRYWIQKHLIRDPSKSIIYVKDWDQMKVLAEAQEPTKDAVYCDKALKDKIKENEK